MSKNFDRSIKLQAHFTKSNLNALIVAVIFTDTTMLVLALFFWQVYLH